MRITEYSMIDTLTTRLLWIHVLFAFLIPSHNCLGQGQSAFANNPVVPIFYEDSGEPAGPEVTVGLYYSGDSGATQDELLLGATTQVITSGIFNNGGQPVTLPLPIGSRYIVEIRAWTGGFGSFEEALIQGDPGTDQAGGSGILLPLVLGGGASPAPNLFSNGGLGSIALTPVPEPSTMWLGIMGSLLTVGLLRRRKLAF